MHVVQYGLPMGEPRLLYCLMLFTWSFCLMLLRLKGGFYFNRVPLITGPIDSLPMAEAAKDTSNYPGKLRNPFQLGT